MEKWVIKTKRKYKTLSTVQKLMIPTLIVVLCFSITSILHWGWVATTIGFVSITLLVILILAFLAEKLRDSLPLRVIDLGEAEHIKKEDKNKLHNYYKEQTGRCVPHLLHIMGTPDEQLYIEWLELQATKYFKLQDTETNGIVNGMAYEDKDAEDY